MLKSGIQIYNKLCRTCKSKMMLRYAKTKQGTDPNLYCWKCKAMIREYEEKLGVKWR